MSKYLIVIYLALAFLSFDALAFELASGTSDDLVETLGFEQANFGVSAGVAGGFSDFNIKTAESESIYSGLGIDARLSIPIWQNKATAINTDFSYRYLDASNTANSLSSKEFMRLSGPGVGLNFNFYRLLIGADYHFYRSTHYWIGNPQGELNYNMGVFSYGIGLHLSISKNMQLMFSYSKSSGNLPNDQTNFASDTPFESNTFWVHLTYGSGESLVEFFTSLFK